MKIIGLIMLVPIFITKYRFGPSIFSYLNLVPILKNLIQSSHFH